MSQQQASTLNNSNNRIVFSKELKGQCAFAQIQYLKFNPLKTLFSVLLLTISVVGLLFLKYFKKLRVAAFYDRLQINHRAMTHVYVSDVDGNQEISKIFQKELDSRTAKTFHFQHLQFEIIKGQILPLMMNCRQNINLYWNEDFVKIGLSKVEAGKRQQFYGRNEHNVEVPNYFEYLFDVMTKPFFLFQYMISTFYILQHTPTFGITMLCFSFVTTSINYLLLRRSYRQIKQIAEKQFKVKVIRDSICQEINNTDLVPGDIYKPEGQMPCDSLILQGNLFANQAVLTGENVPIPKTQLSHKQHLQKHCHWLFEGSTIESTQKNSQVLALVVNVGFGSKRGRIIRKILTKIPKQPQFFNKLSFFLLEILLVSLIIYFATLKYLLSFNLDTIMVVFRLFDFIIYSFPAPFPIFFNLVYSFALIRLNNKGIIGVQPEKTVESGRLKTLCFDKTGTLTQNKVQISKIYQIQQDGSIIKLNTLTFGNSLIASIFGCCNSVDMVEGQPRGDVIDLQMFTFSNAKIDLSSRAEIIRQISIENQFFDVLKINQYESEFQSMSVLVRLVNQVQPKYYIFAKGSPQIIAIHSQRNYQHLDTLIKDLSLEGFRSLALGYRQVSEEEVKQLLKEDRGSFLRNINPLAIVTFMNSLKEDSRETVEVLTENQINTKMITGDNIFLAVRTAVNVGIIQLQTKITIVQGSKFNFRSNSAELVHFYVNRQGVFSETTQKMINFSFQDHPNLVYAVDNQFISKHKDFFHDKIKVFARISPENKAVIVRRQKELYQKDNQKLAWYKKMFRDCEFKVGMVGDGANDLIAIKQAHVGIAVAGTDAIYSSSFAIQNLRQIIQIIKQAKNAERQIIQIVRYFSFTQLLSLGNTIILIKDSTYLTGLELIYKNFASTLIITVFFGLSKVSSTLTKHLNSTNFLGKQNHLVYWGNLLIYTSGLFISYEYYYRSDDFTPNPYPQVTVQTGYYSKTKSSTVIFMCSNIVYTFFPMFVYRSRPWKQPFYKNIALTIVIGLNVVLSIGIFFKTKDLSFLDLQPIGMTESIYLLVIMMTASLVSFFYNLVVQRCVDNIKQSQNAQQKNKRRKNSIDE